MDKNNAIAIVFDDHLLFADSFSVLVERFNIFGAVYTFDDKKKITHFLVDHSKMHIFLFLDYYLKNENSLTLINEVKRLNRRSAKLYCRLNKISGCSVMNDLLYVFEQV